MCYYIYKITFTHPETCKQKVYIGQTNNLNQRWCQYKSSVKNDGKKSCMLIVRAMSKHGIENFKFEAIDQSETQEEINNLEIKYIADYNSIDKSIGYNIDLGGNCSPRTDEFKKKLSKSLKKYYKTHENKNKGQKRSEETKAKMSEAAIGKPGTNTGKQFDENWKTKISKSNFGKVVLENRRFSQEIEQEICRLYIDGISTYKLGNNYKCSRSLILSILDRNNIEKRQSNCYKGNIFSIEKELEICNEYKSNSTTISALSKKCNCGKTTIRSILLRNGINLKDPNGKET